MTRYPVHVIAGCTVHTRENGDQEYIYAADALDEVHNVTSAELFKFMQDNIGGMTMNVEDVEAMLKDGANVLMFDNNGAVIFGKNDPTETTILHDTPTALQ